MQRKQIVDAAEQKSAYPTAIRQLAAKRERSGADVETVAKTFGQSRSTVYRALAKLPINGSLSRKPRTDAGSHNIDQRVDRVISESIASPCVQGTGLVYPSAASLTRVISKRCEELGIPIPHSNTVRNRLDQLNNSNSPNEQNVSGIRPFEELRIDFLRIYGRSPERNFQRPPWPSVPDDWPIWVALSVDPNSLAVLGYSGGYDCPLLKGIRLCLRNSLLPKSQTLRRLNISAKWPMLGMPEYVSAILTPHMHKSRSAFDALECDVSNCGIKLECQFVTDERMHGIFIEKNLATLCFRLRQAVERLSESRDLDPDNLERAVVNEILVYNREINPLRGFEPMRGLRLALKCYSKVRRPTSHSTEGLSKMDRIRSIQRYLGEVVCAQIFDYGIVVDEEYYNHEILQSWRQRSGNQTNATPGEVLFREDPESKSIYFLDPAISRFVTLRRSDKRESRARDYEYLLHKKRPCFRLPHRFEWNYPWLYHALKRIANSSSLG